MLAVFLCFTMVGLLSDGARGLLGERSSEDPVGLSGTRRCDVVTPSAALTDDLERLSELGAGNDVNKEVDCVIDLRDEFQYGTDVINVSEYSNG